MNRNLDLDSDSASSRNRVPQTQIDLVPSWQQAIWKSSAIGLMLMIFGLVLLVAYMLAQMLALLQLQTPDNAFVFSGMTVVSASLLRLLAILIGGAIAFFGLAVSFFAHQKATSIDADLTHDRQTSATFALATNSPGIVAVVIGALVIIYALYSKGTHTYVPGYKSGEKIVPPKVLPPSEVLLKDEKSEDSKQPVAADKSNNFNSPPEK